MSSGPTLIGETYVTATKRVYLNIDFSIKDWCKYNGSCRIDDLLPTSIPVCLLCKYRKPLDLPAILDKKHEERIRK